MELNQIYTRLVNIKEDYEVAHEQAQCGRKDSAQKIADETTKRFEMMAEIHPEFDKVVYELMAISRAILKLRLIGVEISADQTQEKPNPYH